MSQAEDAACDSTKSDKLEGIFCDLQILRSRRVENSHVTFSGSLVVIESVLRSPKRENRSFNRFFVIKYNQLRANKTSCHWFIFALIFLCRFLGCLSVQWSDWKEIGWMPIKITFYATVEIKRLIVWYLDAFDPFLYAVHFQMAQAFGLPFPVAWVMSDDTSKENATGFQLTALQSDGISFLINLQPQIHQLTFSSHLLHLYSTKKISQP